MCCAGDVLEAERMAAASRALEEYEVAPVGEEARTEPPKAGEYESGAPGAKCTYRPHKMCSDRTRFPALVVWQSYSCWSLPRWPISRVLLCNLIESSWRTIPHISTSVKSGPV